MDRSEDEENITETTVMLEMEEAEDRASSQEFPPRENMTKTEFMARGGFQESCGTEYYEQEFKLHCNLFSAKLGDAAEICNQLIVFFSFFLMVATLPFSLLLAIKWTQVDIGFFILKMMAFNRAGI